MKLFLLLTCIVTTAYSNEILNPKEKNEFFGKTFANNLPTQEQIKKPLVKINECVSAIKNDESFWNHHETAVFKVEAIGDHNIKLKKFIFLKKHQESWYYDDTAIALPFELQYQLEITSCPKDDKKLTEEQFAKYIKNNN
jgi:hypothetical protein